MIEQAALVKPLHDRRLALEVVQRVRDPLLPFRVGKIGPERDAAAPPA